MEFLDKAACATKIITSVFARQSCIAVTRRYPAMAERRGFLLMAIGVGVMGVAVGAYVMWGMLVDITSSSGAMPSP